MVTRISNAYICWHYFILSTVSMVFSVSKCSELLTRSLWWFPLWLLGDQRKHCYVSGPCRCSLSFTAWSLSHGPVSFQCFELQDVSMLFQPFGISQEVSISHNAKASGSTTSLSNICLCQFITCPKICLVLGKDYYVQGAGMENLSM